MNKRSLYFTPTLLGDDEACYNVYVADSNLLDEVATLGEDLHTGTFVSTIAHNILPSMTHHRNLTWVP